MYKPSIEPILLFNPNSMQLERYYNVFLQVVGTSGSIYLEEGPITIIELAQVHEAIAELKERIGIKLSTDTDKETENAYI